MGLRASDMFVVGDVDGIWEEKCGVATKGWMFN